jgi:hypothetical protein
VKNYRTSGEAAGGALGGGTSRQSSPLAYMSTTPDRSATVPNNSRTDVRAAVLPLVLRLTQRMLAPGAGVASRDSYVLHVRKDIAKGKANPVGMIAAIAYDDIRKGRSAHEVRSWLLELCEEIDVWEAERDGHRLSPPDLTPLLRLEARHEGRENELAVSLGDQSCPDVLEQFAAALEQENDVQDDVIDLAKKRAAFLRRSRANARAL